MLLVTCAFIVLLMMGMPVAFAIGISGTLFFLQHPELPSTIPIQLTVTQTQNFALLAVPLFIMAGNFMSTIAGVMVGSMIADAFLGNSGFDPGLGDIAADAGSAVEEGVGEVAGGFEDFGSDLGSDFGGDFGGDF